MYLNKVIIAGNLTKDVELRTTQQGTAVCSFTVAVNRKTKQSDGSYRDEVDFVDCNAWDKKAEFLHRYFHKGEGVCVLGTIRNRKWTDKNGQARVSTEVLAEDVLFNGEKAKQAEQGKQSPEKTYTQPTIPTAPAPAEPVRMETVDDDQELPF